MYSTIRILVFGKVTGVSFRSEAKAYADSIGVVGSVRNLEKSLVEIIAQGDEDSIGDFLSWCTKGSKKSKVKSIEYHYLENYDLCSDFEIIE